jgi:hypothetical protein
MPDFQSEQLVIVYEEIIKLSYLIRLKVWHNSLVPIDHFCFKKTICFDKVAGYRDIEENISFDTTTGSLVQKVSNEKKHPSSEKQHPKPTQEPKKIKRSVSNFSAGKQNCGGS